MLGAVAVLVLALGYVLGIEPYLEYRARLNVSVQVARDTLSFVEQAAASIKRMRGAGGKRTAAQASSRSLLSRIDKRARELGLGASLKRMEPAAGQVRVWVENARFDELLRLFADLSSKAGVEVSELRLRKNKIAGLANGRIVFAERGRP